MNATVLRCYDYGFADSYGQFDDLSIKIDWIIPLSRQNVNSLRCAALDLVKT
jgi:hypothetical protein